MAAIVNDLSEYLKTSPYIDWKHELVLDRAARLRAAGKGELEWIAGAYRFVKDEISHSWDAQDKRVTVSASDVLREKTGICWAKANLLAVLLRACGIPAGILLPAADAGRYAGKRVLHPCPECGFSARSGQVDQT